MLEMEVKCKCDKNCINSFHKRAQWPFFIQKWDKQPEFVDVSWFFDKIVVIQLRGES